MTNVRSTDNFLTTFNVVFLLCAGFFTLNLNSLVREGGLTGYFLAYSNVSGLGLKNTPFPYEKPHYFNLYQSSPFDVIPGHSSSYVLTTFLQLDFHIFSLLKNSAAKYFSFSSLNLSKFIADRWPFWPFQHVQGGDLG